MVGRLIHTVIVAIFLVVAGSAFAASEDSSTSDTVQAVSLTPHQVIDSVTAQLLETISQYRESFDADSDPFFSALDGLLKDAVDFDWIAYRVMGSYAKKATPEQRKRFAEIFHRDLIETYGRGLMAYGEQSIEVIPPTEDISGLRKVNVVQEIRGQNEVFPLVYAMGLNKEGKWKVTNVVINGINLGKTFRNQFIQRAQKSGDDIEQVINNWSSES